MEKSKAQNKKKKKSSGSTPLLILILLAGLALMLYPTIADYWNSLHQSRAVAQYTEEVANLDKDKYAEILDAARRYNKSLWTEGNRYELTPEEREEYNSLLNVSGNGIMGYIEIPVIDCALPIYHGVEDSVLQIAIGHLEWSSLPVGGEGTHCVVSGHRGLPSAKLFTNLDKLVPGDTFVMCILNETITYEVDQIHIVLPHELNNLTIDPKGDYCTLVTCTPYGINTHRMLVRGHRVANTEKSESIHVTADAIKIDPLLIAPVLAVPILLFLFLSAILAPSKKKKTRKKSK